MGLTFLQICVPRFHSSLPFAALPSTPMPAPRPFQPCLLPLPRLPAEGNLVALCLLAVCTGFRMSRIVSSYVHAAHPRDMDVSHSSVPTDLPQNAY